MELSLMIIAALAMLALANRSMALSANANFSRYVDQEIRSYPMAAGVHIWRSGFVGLDPAKYLKPFEPGDLLVGIAYEEVDNSGGAAGAVSCRVQTIGDFVLALTGAAQEDVGKPIFATADDALSLTGHPDGYLGRIIAVTATDRVLVRLKAPGDIPMTGCVLIDVDFAKTSFAPLLAAGATSHVAGVLRLDCIGAGIVAVGIAPDPDTGEARMLLDNDNEAENLTIATPMGFNITKGITCLIEGRLKTAGGAATDDVDFGIAGLAGGLTATERANMNATTAGLKSCLFHMDANANDIFMSSDDDVSPIAAADTTVDNSLTDNKKHLIVARPGGACQCWIDAARKLASTAFSVSATGLFGAVVNLEKSTGTGVPEFRVRRLRIAGASA